MIAQIKLITNQEIVAAIEEEGPRYILRNPMLVERMVTPDGRFFYTMRSFFLEQFADNKDVSMVLDKSKVLIKIQAPKSIVEQYNVSYTNLTAEPETYQSLDLDEDDDEYDSDELLWLDSPSKMVN